ncbi:hypothetical protein RJ639_013753 [Escallonia herrerae]|uniref:Dirigent protein n=1 Tax=Escallonia herrerae TaxID=1293975 RepID=A0AA89AMH8_9ASTE|nr:hypothetical protein RJ639_013753 [Escallonia herrerae]
MGKLTAFPVLFTMLMSFRVITAKTKGKNPTAALVAHAQTTSTSLSFFGLVNMVDDPLTVGPEQPSKLVGRAHGFYASSSQEKIGLLCTLNFVFKEGEYNGSSLAVLGHNPTMHVYG